MKDNIRPQHNGKIQSESYGTANYLVLVIPRLPRGATEHPKYRDLMKNTSCEGIASWPDDGEWYPMVDGIEVNHFVRLASLESLTEEQYSKFSEVVVPFEDTYTGFEKPDLPSLDWLKHTFPNHPVVAQCHRRAQRTLDKFKVKETERIG